MDDTQLIPSSESAEILQFEGSRRGRQHLARLGLRSLDVRICMPAVLTNAWYVGQ
jgi:hypothetical protein